jgi:hypothetical protein
MRNQGITVPDLVGAMTGALDTVPESEPGVAA